MNTFTPGPWVLKHISGSNFAVQRFEIRSGSGMPHPIFNKDISAIDGTTVCMSPQDANLIAAAPCLLEALIKLVEFYQHNGSPEEHDIQAEAYAAIAKARGES